MEYLLQTDQNQSINIFVVKIVPLEIICFVWQVIIHIPCTATYYSFEPLFFTHNTTYIHRYLWSKSGWCSCFERNLTDDVSILTRQKMILPLKGHLSVGCSRIQFRLNEEPINAAAKLLFFFNKKIDARWRCSALDDLHYLSFWLLLIVICRIYKVTYWK